MTPPIPPPSPPLATAGPAAALTFPHASPPAYGQTLPVLSGIDWLRMPLPFALDHVNLWLLADEGGWTAIDTGIATEAVKQAWTPILQERQLTRLIVTHYHPDHVGLAHWLEAPLWMTPDEYRMARLTMTESEGRSVQSMLHLFRRHGLDDARLATLTARGNAYAQGVPALPETFRPLAENEILDIGGNDWHPLIGHGHSPAHLSLYAPALGVLIAGDMLLPRISTNISILYDVPAQDPRERDPLAAFLATLTRLETLPADTLVLPSHGLPFRGLGHRIEQLRRHHVERCAALLAACRNAPQTAAELLPVLFTRDIPDPHQLRFAMGEAIAHLIHLECMGRLHREDTQNVIHFAA